jgi:hypothetical protein
VLLAHLFGNLTHHNQIMRLGPIIYFEDATFEVKLKALCERISTCQTKQEDDELTRELWELVKKRIKYLNNKLHLVKG